MFIAAAAVGGYFLGKGGKDETKNDTKIRQQSNKTIINESQLNIMNESLMQSATNVVLENAKICGASSTMRAGNVIQNATTGGGVRISGTSISQDATVDLSCIQTTQTKSDIVTKISKELDNHLKNRMDTDSATKLESTAKNLVENGSLRLGGSDTVNINDINMEDNLYQRTTSGVNVSNVVANIVSANFTQRNIDDCTVKLAESAENRVSNVVDTGNVGIVIENTTIEQAGKAVNQCFQSSDIINNITNDVVENLGIDVEQVQSSTDKTEMSAEVENEVKNKGMIDEFFGGLGDLFGGGNLLLIIIIIAIIAGAGFVIYMVLGPGSGGGGGGDTTIKFEGKNDGNEVEKPVDDPAFIEPEPKPAQAPKKKRRPMPMPPQSASSDESRTDAVEDPVHDGGRLSILKLIRPYIIYFVIIILSLHILLKNK